MKPNFLKFPKAQKGGRFNPGIKLDKLIFGDYGIVANEAGIIKSTHISTAQLAMKRQIKREGNIYNRVFPHLPVTKKPSEVRMGKGKGSVNHFITKVQKGSIIFEIKCSEYHKAFTALSIAKSKLPLSSSFIYKKCL